MYFLTAPLAYRRSIIEERALNSLKPRPFIKKINCLETILWPIRSFHIKENHIGLAVSEIHRYRQKKLTAFYNSIIIILWHALFIKIIQLFNRIAYFANNVPCLKISYLYPFLLRLPIIVVRSLLPRSVFSGPPTRDLSSPPFSLEKVLHSDPTSITLNKGNYF